MKRNQTAWRAGLASLVVVLSLLHVPQSQAQPAPLDQMVADVLAGLSLANRQDVASCLLADAAAHPARLDEITRLATIINWINRSITQPRSSGASAQFEAAKARAEALSEIVASFNHERRIDTNLLTRISGGELQPRHISAYARVTRALNAGHEPRRIFCGE